MGGFDEEQLKDAFRDNEREDSLPYSWICHVPTTASVCDRR